MSIHLSGGISGTVRSAEQARDQLVEGGLDPERIVVFDSRTACGGMGFTLMAAAAAAARGAVGRRVRGGGERGARRT